MPPFIEVIIGRAGTETKISWVSGLLFPTTGHSNEVKNCALLVSGAHVLIVLV